MDELIQFNKDIIDAHNGLRKSHNVENLMYDETLAIASQAYAELLAELEVLKHSKSFERPNIGENLAFSCKSYVNYRFSGKSATAGWYSEIKDYNFKVEKQKEGNPPTCHFTQVIWKVSKMAGFGRAQSVNKGWYIVGRYFPCGNVLGKYMENIPISLYSRWEDLPVIQEYLEELRTMEYTRARKHVLDNCSSKTKMTNIDGKKTFTVTETFESPVYGIYSDSEVFMENPSKLPRPTMESNDKQEYSLHHNNESEILNRRFSDQNSDNGNDIYGRDNRFQLTVLNQHNIYRKSHGVPLLALDNKLSELAQIWAKTLADEDYIGFCNCIYNNSEVGENISLIMEKMTLKSGNKIIDRWYEEEKFYSYNKEPQNYSKVGHFTQLVWKETKIIGVGLSENSSGHGYFVCFYYPPGNIEQRFSNNIFQPKNSRNG